MQLGILGLSKSGKTTLFNTLTASQQATGKFGASAETHLGVAAVRDPRLEQLRDLFKPRRYVPATVQYVDIPGIKRGESAESIDLGKLKTVLQIAAVIALIVANPAPLGVNLLVYAALIVTVISGADYFFGLRRRIEQQQKERAGAIPN